MTLTAILVLYLVFRVKQVLCDFFLQTPWMALEKGRPFGEGGAKPLFAHASIHAVFTLAIVLLYAPSLWWLGPLDFVIHGIVDRLKVMVTKSRGWTYGNSEYWWAFGVDQELHNLTHLLYIILIVAYLSPDLI